MVEPRNTLFGERIDALAAKYGGWPDGAIVYTIEAIGSGENASVLLSGAIPVGHCVTNGRPKFAAGRKGELRAACKISEYRAGLTQAETPSDTLGEKA